MCLDRRQHENSRDRLERVHEAAVVDRDPDLLRMKADEEGALARHVPSAVSRAVRQDDEVIVFAARFESATCHCRQLVGGEGGDLVENVPLRELAAFEEGGDAVRDGAAQGDGEERECDCLVDDVLERRVALVPALSSIELVELLQLYCLIEASRLGRVDKEIARTVDDDLDGFGRWRAAARLQTSDRRLGRQHELVWIGLEYLSQAILRPSL